MRFEILQILEDFIGFSGDLLVYFFSSFIILVDVFPFFFSSFRIFGNQKIHSFFAGLYSAWSIDTRTYFENDIAGSNIFVFQTAEVDNGF